MKKKIAIISLIIILIDQIIKIIVDNYLTSLTVIDNFFVLKKVYNDGAAFSFFTGQTVFLVLVSIVILGYLIHEIKNFKTNKRNIFAFSLLIGGLVGNLIDRIIYGHVIDYLKVELFNFPIFNIADMCIFFGVCLLIVAIIKKEDVYGNSSKRN